MPDTSSSSSSKLHFEKDDAFGWSGFASKLEAFLLTEKEFVEGSLVVSLNAPFGSGNVSTDVEEPIGHPPGERV